jgi:hypothetical protein
MTLERRELLNMIDEWAKRQTEPFGGKYGDDCPGWKTPPIAVRRAKQQITRLERIVSRYTVRKRHTRARLLKVIDAKKQELRWIALYEKPMKAAQQIRQACRVK